MATHVVLTKEGAKFGQAVKSGPRVTKIQVGDEIVSARTKEIDTPLCSWVLTISKFMKMLREAIEEYSIFCGSRNHTNFHICTFADWKTAERPDREPDYVSGSGSKYWYAADGVYRASDHWTFVVATCNWGLDGYYVADGVERCGFCRWEDFKTNPMFAWREEEARRNYERMMRYAGDLGLKI